MQTLRQLWRDDRAEDVVEYGLIAALFSTICIAAIHDFGLAVMPLWQKINNVLSKF